MPRSATPFGRATSLRLGAPALLLLLLSAGCASRRPAAAPAAPSAPAASPLVCAPGSSPACIDPHAPRLVAAYVAALDAARYPSPKKISHDLVPILRSTPGLEWNASGQVKLATWTKAAYFADRQRFAPGKTFPLYGDTWFTIVPFVQRFCSALGLEGALLALRLEQLFGLPPKDDKDAFLEVWVNPADLFRPCPDPEIGDHECQVEIPVLDCPDEDASSPRPPWPCHCLDAPQVSGAFVKVDPAHLKWMCDNWTSTYGNADPLSNFPWTALGYTYDWGNPDDPRGMSEYVARKGAEVVFDSLRPTDAYCAR